jgi:thermitase
MEMDKLHQLIDNKSSTNNKGTTLIAILDTGVESNHEDLKDNYVSINTSYDRDVRGHGTHCAGIAAAVTGNNIGIASLLPSKSKIKVTSIKVLSNFGFGAQHQIIAGMIEAADKGADVISMSLGAPANPDREKTYNEAVKYANAQGAIVIVAAGNSNADAAQYSPANTPGVIAVAAINQDLKKASFSNTIDKIQMGIAAPGQEIYSTFKGNSYTYQSGTSMAAPFISGLVGLMKSIDPEMNTKEAFQILNSTSSKSGNLNIVRPYMAIEKMLK